jgi:hypothetical protein
MTAAEPSATSVVTAFLQDAVGHHLAPAEAEWGLVLDDVAGGPLEIGLRLAGGLLRAQAWVAPTGAVDPHRLLHRNRLEPLARYSHSAAGEVYVHAEIPERAIAPEELDRMMMALISAAEAARS